MTTLQSNIRVANVLRSAVEFGTLEQCLEASMLCHELEKQGYNLTRVEDRLWERLTAKIERLQNASNEGVWHAIYR